MKLRTVYKLHRWISIFFGVVLFNQLITGAVMVLPRSSPGKPEAHPPVDYHAITLSPAEAIEKLALDREEDELDRPVTAVSLHSILGKPFYEVKLQGGATHLIDAKSGQKVEITREMAERIARSALGSAAAVRRIERLENHDYRWRHGALPVYRIEFQNPGASVAYVNATNGAVGGLSNRWGRIRSLLAGMHEFQPIGWFLGSNPVRKALLLIVAIVGIGTALTGYFLALPRGKSRPGSRPRASSLESKQSS